MLEPLECIVGDHCTVLRSWFGIIIVEEEEEEDEGGGRGREGGGCGGGEEQSPQFPAAFHISKCAWRVLELCKKKEKI